MITDKAFGALISELIQKKNLSREESKSAFRTILKNETNDMQQGAFLAGLTAKGETEEEVAGSWEAIYELDTVKTDLSDYQIVENCGTGMDSIKTFNISTAASLVAAAAGVRIARHGARGITSVCGTVDISECLGVDVACDAETVAHSVKEAGLGLYNGMSPEVHPQALGRILSQINFGSTLNIAASLANPAMPAMGVRGVYAKELLTPVIRVMKSIGYKRAIVLNGGVDGSEKSMDEASVCGLTWCKELAPDGMIESFSFTPEEFGLEKHEPNTLSPERNIQEEVLKFLSVILGKGSKARTDAVILNAALVIYISGKADTLAAGIQKAKECIKNGSAVDRLRKWVSTQNRDPKSGTKILETHLANCSN